MPESNEELFNDFFLCALDHLNSSPFSSNGTIRDGLNEKIQEVIDAGIDSIKANSKKGDTIAMEHPEPVSFEVWHDLFYPKHQYDANPEELMKELWDKFYRLQSNTYAKIAEEARKLGRTVVSLESTKTKAGSRLQREWFHTKSATKSVRLNYILLARRDKQYVRKIQRIQPAMVITASGHGVYIEHVLKPKRVEYFPSRNREYIQKQLETQLSAHRRAREQREKRRARANWARKNKGKPQHMETNPRALNHRN